MPQGVVMNLRPRSIKALNSKLVNRTESSSLKEYSRSSAAAFAFSDQTKISPPQNPDLIDGVSEKMDNSMFLPPSTDEYIDGVLLVSDPEKSKKLRKGQLLYFYCDKDTLKNGAFSKADFKEGLMVDFDEDFNGICTVEIHDTELVKQEGKWVMNVNDNSNFKKYININYVPVVGVKVARPASESAL